MKIYNRTCFVFALLNLMFGAINFWMTFKYNNVANVIGGLFSTGVGIWAMSMSFWSWNGIEPNKGHPPYAPCVPETDAVMAGEIIAWRAWRPCGPTLRSTYIDCTWDYEEPMHGIPGNGFGVFAMKDVERIKKFYPELIFGRVALWGDVIEHQYGYRAEYAKIISLDIGPSEKDLDHYRKLYKVGIHSLALAPAIDSKNWTGRRG